MVISMEIGGISSLYTDYMKSSADKSASALTDKLSSDYSEATDDELMDVCKEFEAYFMEKMFNAMIETTKVFSSEEEDSYATKMVDYFKDSAITDLASQATQQNGVGLAQTLYTQLRRQYSAVTPQEAAASKVEENE